MALHAKKSEKFDKGEARQPKRHSQPAIPEKLYFKIGEVARLVGVAPYVLRYWETEFSDMIPPKSRGKQRLYRRRDIERIFEIKHLLWEDKFTIDGARRRLKGSNGHAASRTLAAEHASSAVDTRMARDTLLSIKNRLETVLTSLAQDAHDDVKG